jgi:hypothetical protein
MSQGEKHVVDRQTDTHTVDSGGIGPVQLQQTFNLWEIRTRLLRSTQHGSRRLLTPQISGPHTTWQQTVAYSADTSPDVNLATSHEPVLCILPPVSLPLTLPSFLSFHLRLHEIYVEFYRDL